MNAKIISIITIINTVVALIIIIFTGVIVYNNFKSKSVIPMDCTSMIYVNTGEREGQHEIPSAVLKFVFHIKGDYKMHVTQYGTIKYNGNNYTLDRLVNLSISPKKHNGYYEVTRINSIPNIKDNVPAEILENFVPSQPVLFYKIEKIDPETWRISDPKRTIFVCRR